MNRKLDWFAKRTVPGYVLAFSLIYTAGEILQVSLIGPNWLRWHLSDFGFPISVMQTITVFLGIPLGYSLILAGLIGVGYEGYQFLIGTGDPFDVVSILLGCIFATYLLKKRR